MVDLVIAAFSPSTPNSSSMTVRVQLKDKKGRRGTYLELHDLKHEQWVSMPARPGYRLKAWYIGPDEKLLPGSSPEKRTITEAEDRQFQALGFTVYWDHRTRSPVFLYDQPRSSERL
jgi:hypothetical protein